MLCSQQDEQVRMQISQETLDALVGALTAAITAPLIAYYLSARRSQKHSRQEKIERISASLQKASFCIDAIRTHHIRPLKKITQSPEIHTYAEEMTQCLMDVYTTEMLYFPDRFCKESHAVMQASRLIRGVSENGYYFDGGRLVALSQAIHNYQVALWNDMNGGSPWRLWPKWRLAMRVK